MIDYLFSVCKKYKLMVAIALINFLFGIYSLLSGSSIFVFNFIITLYILNDIMLMSMMDTLEAQINNICDYIVESKKLDTEFFKIWEDRLSKLENKNEKE